LVRGFHPQGGVRESNPLKLASQNPLAGVADFEQRELDARRAAIDRQDASVRDALLYRGGVVSSFFITACSLFQSRRTSLARFSLLSEVGAMAAT
jgi:hypothetical protein